MTKTLNALAANLRYLLERHGLNPNSLAGLVHNQPPQPTILRIRNGEVQTPRDATIQPIADYFNVSVHALRYEDLASADQGNEPGDTIQAARIRTQRVPVISLADLQSKESLWEPSGALLFEASLYAYLATSNPKAFLTLVNDDCMHPRFKLGEYARIEPGRPVEIEDEVLVKTTNHDVILARLVSRRGGGLRLAYHNKPNVDFIESDSVVWQYAACNPVPTDDVGNL